MRKGEHGSLVVYADRFTKTETDDSGGETQRSIPFLKSYTAFNVEQIEGLPPHYYALAEPVLDPAQRIAHAEAFFAATRADIRHGGDRAYYNKGEDFVQMRRSRPSAMSKATTQHWRTNAPTGRGTASAWSANLAASVSAMKATPWKSSLPSLAQRFFALIFPLHPEPREDHAAYIAYWLKVLKDDKRAVFTAAAHCAARRRLSFKLATFRPAGGRVGGHHHHHGGHHHHGHDGDGCLAGRPSREP